MKYKKLNGIAFPISTISFGAWQLGNNEFFGEMNDEDAIDLVKEAVKQGINLFDTAPGYGGGNSERLLGIALKEYRDKVFINTKFGHKADGTSDFSVEALEPGVKDSLKRLQTNYLDSVILHNPGKDMLYGSHPIYKEFQRLKSNGIINHYGVSIDSYEELDIVLHHNNVDVIALMFNIIHQSPKDLFDEIEKQGILLIIKVPLDSGWLTGKYTKQTKHTGVRSRWTKEVIDTRLSIVNKIKEILPTENLVHASLQFILNHKAVTSVIPGTRNMMQLLSNVEASNYILSQQKQQQLYDLYDQYIKTQYTPW